MIFCKHVECFVAFPMIDLCQKLTLSPHFLQAEEAMVVRARDMAARGTAKVEVRVLLVVALCFMFCGI